MSYIVLYIVDIVVSWWLQMAAQAIVGHQSSSSFSQCLSIRSGGLNVHQRGHQQKQFPSSSYRDDGRPAQSATRRVRDSVERSAHHTGVSVRNSGSYSPSTDFAAAYYQPEAVLASVSCYANGETPSGGEQQNGYNCHRRSVTAGYHPHRSSASLEWNRTLSTASAYNGHYCASSETTGAGQLLVVRRKLSEDSTSCRVVQQTHRQPSGSAAVCSPRSQGMSNTRAQPPLTTVVATSHAVDHCSWSPVDVPRRRVSTMTSSTGCGPKLSRAVSEYSLHGSRYNGNTMNEDDQMFYGDVSWRSVVDGDSPPRIAPISGQLSKVSVTTSMLEKFS